MTAPLESSIVRFRKSNGAVVGAGFLVFDKHILTCAHVVADALGIARDTQDIPTEDVYLDFPLVDSEKQLTAKVVFWSPVPAKGSTSVKGKEDIAGLKLQSSVPEGVQPVALIIEEDLRGHPFRTFGFPSGHDDGLEATGVLRGRQGAGWVQLEDVKQTGVRLEPGFSGAPVWDEELNGVVGMAVAADQKRPEAKVAFMIPTERLATAWSALGRFTIPPLSLVDKEPLPLWYETSWRWICIAMIPILSATVLLIPQVQKGLKIGQPSCFDIARKEGKLAIAVANFSDSRGQISNDLLTEEQILDQLKTQELPNIEVCFTAKSVSTREEAQKLGKKLKAAVVIWGRQNRSTREVFVTAVDLNVRYLTSLSVSTANTLNYDLYTKDWSQLIAVMTAFSLSEIYNSKEQITEAREVLAEALQEAEISNLDTDNESVVKVLAKAYFFFGLLVDSVTDPNCENTIEDCKNALQAYKRSSELDKKLYDSLLNQGLLYERLQDPQQAIKVYTQIVKSEPESLVGAQALASRARISLEQGDAKAAVRDLQLICKQQPDNPKYLHFLGLAQLQAGQTAEAVQTYRDAKPYLDKDAKAVILEELHSLIRQSPELTKVINTITSEL